MDSLGCGRRPIITASQPVRGGHIAAASSGRPGTFAVLPITGMDTASFTAHVPQRLPPVKPCSRVAGRAALRRSCRFFPLPQDAASGTQTILSSFPGPSPDLTVEGMVTDPRYAPQRCAPIEGGRSAQQPGAAHCTPTTRFLPGSRGSKSTIEALRPDQSILRRLAESAGSEPKSSRRMGCSSSLVGFF